MGLRQSCYDRHGNAEEEGKRETGNGKQEGKKRKGKSRGKKPGASANRTPMIISNELVDSTGKPTDQNGQCPFLRKESGVYTTTLRATLLSMLESEIKGG